MITRTSQPASGAMLISEMKEFASFSKATQRYIRRSLDVAYGRRDPIECWARDEGEAASIRAQGRLYKQLDHHAPAGSRRQRPRHDRAVHRHADHGFRVRPRPGPPAAFRRSYRFLYERLIGASAPAVAAVGLLLGRRAAAPSPRPPPDPAAVDQRKRCDRAGLVEPRAGVLAGVGREGRRHRGCLSGGTFTDGKIFASWRRLSSRVLVMDEHDAVASHRRRGGFRGRRPARRRRLHVLVLVARHAGDDRHAGEMLGRPFDLLRRRPIAERQAGEDGRLANA